MFGVFCFSLRKMKEHIPAGNRELQSRVEAPLHRSPEQKCSGFFFSLRKMKEHIPAGNRELRPRVEAPLHRSPEQT